jgi:dCMP deaminase
VHDTRPAWDDYFLEVATAVARRADCTRRRVGAVLVRDHLIIATGYNGTAPGRPGCLEGACPRGQLSYDELAEHTDYDSGPGRCIAVHAEANALLWARGTETQGSTCYVTHEPCPGCRKLLLGAGVLLAIWPGGHASL